MKLNHFTISRNFTFLYPHKYPFVRSRKNNSKSYEKGILFLKFPLVQEYRRRIVPVFDRTVRNRSFLSNGQITSGDTVHIAENFLKVPTHERFKDNGSFEMTYATRTSYGSPASFSPFPPYKKSQR